MLDVFIKAIEEKKFIEVTFFAKKDNLNRTRKCVPFDYAYSKRDKNPIKKYQQYDLDSPSGIHNLVKLNESFDPAEYISWEANWELARDWGEYS